LALGLVTDAETTAEQKITSMHGELSAARDILKAEEQRGANTRDIVETQLRAWAGASNSLQMAADDLFANSVEKELQRKTRQLEAKNEEDRSAVTALEREFVELTAEIQTRTPIVQLARDRWDETVALRNNDQASLKEIRERRDKLLALSGSCQYGGVAYSDCRHVQEQRDTVKLATQRDIGVLSKVVAERDDREAREKAVYESEANALSDLTAALAEKSKQKTMLNNAIEARLRQLGQGDAVRGTLTQWHEGHQTQETEKLRAARVAVANLERGLDAAKGAKVMAQQQVSERERQISARLAELAQAFGANGRYVPAEEKRPFQILGADGDAYTVLEILLGDLACAQDGAGANGGAHPGVLIFDCPREREMSPHLYEKFLTLVDEVCCRVPNLQVIVTTTTPPPEPLREPPVRILKLSRASDDDLLLKRRIQNLLARATPPSRDTFDERDS
jgi:hypothetical protein